MNTTKELLAAQYSEFTVLDSEEIDRLLLAETNKVEDILNDSVAKRETYIDKAGIRYVFDAEKNIYAVDSNDEVVENFPVPEISIRFKGGKAYNRETKEEIEIIEFEDEYEED